MKHCKRCDRDLPMDSFRWKSKEKGLRQAYCIECNIQYNKEHYRNNKKVYADKRTAYRAENGYAPSQQMLFIYKWLSEHPCVDCGIDDPVVLSFDHLDRSTKSFNIGKDRNKYSIERLREEIDKCEVVCMNCHARRTSKQFNWYANIKYTTI